MSSKQPEIDIALNEGPSSPVACTPTLIFLDIDGVLNVGIRDPGSSPLCFNEANFSIARKLAKGSARSDTADMLLAVMGMTTCDGNDSYGDFLSRNDLDVCDVFVHRFVNIVRAAGEGRRIIISSSWRRPKYVSNIRSLEKIISTYIGADFTFDDRTELVDEVDSKDRLRLIGQYISQHCKRDGAAFTELNALVLDDFFYMPMRGFKCGATEVSSVESAEGYLQQCAPSNIKARVKILHTYMSSKLPSGFEVHVGTGLSLSHVRDALSFLHPEVIEDIETPKSKFNRLMTPRVQVEPEDDDLTLLPDISVDTWIFLDIDGVLNVGIRDPGSSPLSFSEANFSIARKLFSGSAKSDAADMLLAVMQMHTGDGNSSTYGDFFSRNDLDVCDIFVHRFVKIIRAAGENRRVIISSSWRKPKYSGSTQKLEQIISVYLGESFKFDDKTALVDEEGGHDRLRLIGNYIKTHCSKDGAPDRLHVLVLDDFFYLPIKDFQLDNTTVNSVESGESYLESCSPPSMLTKAKIIHTYQGSTTESGLEVQIGTGLSMNHLGDALTFLGAMRRQISGRSGEKPAEHAFNGMKVDPKVKWCCSVM